VLPESAPMPSVDLGPLADVDLLAPDPSVAIVAAPAALRRRIAAALDFDRLPLLAEAAEPGAVLAATHDQPPTVAVLAGADPDALLPALGDVQRALRNARVVIVAERLSGGATRRALRAGAVAAVPAESVESALALAVRAASAGLVVVPEAISEEPPILCPRERDALALAASGATIAEIAAEMAVPCATVNSDLSSCLFKLGVDNRPDALALLMATDRQTSDTYEG
jgi:two-component system, NarL family, response regulator DesR